MRNNVISNILLRNNGEQALLSSGGLSFELANQDDFILYHIFKFLTPSQLARVRRVCHRWKKVRWHTFGLLSLSCK